MASATHGWTSLDAISHIKSVYTIEEVDDGPAVIGDLFHRRYREPAPDFPIHVVGFWRGSATTRQPLAYIHLTQHRNALLVGGVCVDNRLMRRLPADSRAVFARAGGIYLYTLSAVFRDYGGRCDAFFGFCGDALAERINQAAGARHTVHPHLMVYYPRPMAPDAAAALIADVHSLGPF